jgi:hypothetical protein
MMAFFEYAIEEYTYNLRKNTKKTDEPLFPDHVTKWLVENENATFDIDYGLWTVPLIKD